MKIKNIFFSLFFVFLLTSCFFSRTEKKDNYVPEGDIIAEDENISNNDESNVNGIQNLSDLQKQLHVIAKKDTSSVVFISTEKIVTRKYSTPFEFFFDDDMYNERQYKQTGLGSGVIFKKKKNDYYIITNNHVIEGADSIEITIDQSKIYKGSIIGSDPQVDIAVVKITTKDELNIAEFGNSDNVQVGDFVVAIGNPFGLSETMTFGIISALGRNNLQSDRITLTDFLQTDAAINPGNSGGPLINIAGDVIGINTLIYSQSGGNIGIGFAVPVNIAKKTAAQLIEKGKVEHGFLGIFYKPLTQDDINTLGLKNINNGMLITEVINNSPAENSDLKPGDVIVELNGNKIKNNNAFAIKIGNSPPGTIIKLKILRNNNFILKTVKLGTRDLFENTKPERSSIIDKYGFEFSELSENIRNQYKIPVNYNGVIITNIAKDSIADKYGLKKGDLIYKINNKNIKNIVDVTSALDNNNRSNYFFIYRNGKEIIINM